jgi:hypothetical protein
MNDYLFLIFMTLWLFLIISMCVAARTRLRQEGQTPMGRAALMLAMTRIPCPIPVEPDKGRGEESVGR